MQNQDSVCFVGRVEEINNIEGADKISQAVISGWECVIQKDEFIVGEKVVIATCDAVIPFELAEKLGITKYLKYRKKTNQYTVKTTKLKGIYSTATIIQRANVIHTYVGEDCMKEFGISKYEEPAVDLVLSTGKTVKYKKNPHFSVYFKFPNAKNAPNMFSEEDDVVITSKIHGANFRSGVVKKDKLSFWTKVKILFFPKLWYLRYLWVYGSHTMEKGGDSQHFYSSDYWKEVADKYDVRNRLWKLAKALGEKNLGEGFIIYGELVGFGVQKYYDYGLKDRELKLFDIKLNGRYLSHDEFLEMAYALDVPTVPILYEGKYNIEIIISLEDRYIPNTKTPEEGMVCAHVSGNRDKIAKFINPAYLAFQSKKDDSTDFH